MTTLTDAYPAQREPAQTRRRRVREVLDPLFPDASGPAITRRGVLLVVLAITVGAAISLARVSGTGPFQSIWEEDARVVLNDALNLSGLRAVLRPVAGYYIMGPKAMGLVVALFPLSWAAALLSIFSALITAAMAVAVYVASGAHLRSPLARLLVSAPLLFAPAIENVESEIQNRPVGLQHFAMYALFWLLLWTPRSTWGKVGLVVSVALTGVSTILIVGYLPLALLRAYQRRDRLSWWILAATVVGSALQLSRAAAGVSGRVEDGSRLDPVWSLATYVFWAVPDSILGYRIGRPLSDVYTNVAATARAQAGLIAAAWLILLAVGLCAWIGARRGLLRPNVTLAILAFGYSVWLNSFMVMANGAIAVHYLLPPELLLFSAVTVLLVPRSGWKSSVPLAVFAAFVLVVSAFNYRWTNTFRAHAPVWTQQIAEAREQCQHNPLLSHVAVRGGPQPWWSVVYVPCHQLIQGVHCYEPSCIYLDPPRSSSRRTDVAVPEAMVSVG